MTTNPQTPTPLVGKRPGLVWTISIFYFLSAGWVILSYALIYSGAIPLNHAQKQYLQSQTFLDSAFSVLIAASNLAGAVFLFELKKPSLPLFAAAFGIGLALTAYQILAKNWLGAIGVAGLIGAVLGWCISIAIIIYSKRLIRRGILR